MMIYYYVLLFAFEFRLSLKMLFHPTQLKTTRGKIIRYPAARNVDTQMIAISTNWPKFEFSVNTKKKNEQILVQVV